MRFSDRREAGRQLAERLRHLGVTDPLVLALPRGGVPVGYEVAVAFGVPLEVFVASKIGAPGHDELGIAAIAEGLDEPVATPLVDELGLRGDLGRLAARARQTLTRRVDCYRAGRATPDVEGRDVLLIDDGLATGVTAEAALRSLRRRRPRQLLLAVPVCSGDTADRLQRIADGVVCLFSPNVMYAVGMWYDDFAQTTDAEVLGLLQASRSQAVQAIR